MRTLQKNNFIIDISEECWGAYPSKNSEYKNPKEHVEKVIIPHLDKMLRRILWNEKINSHQRRPIRALDAHGTSTEDKFIFEDNGKLYSVESWIQQQENPEEVLYLNVCNPANYSVQSGTSTLMYPTGKINDFMIYHQSILPVQHKYIKIIKSKNELIQELNS